MTSESPDDILNDLRAANQALRRFEQRYGLSSDAFYALQVVSFLLWWFGGFLHRYLWHCGRCHGV